MSGLILPPGVGQPKPQPGIGISSAIQLNDSELKALADGPLEWARQQEGESRNIDAFVRALREKIEALGFLVEIKVYDTDQPNVYAFDMEINGRQSGSVFDPDRQVHEVVNNYLGLKGEEGKGWIKSKDEVSKLLNRDFKGTDTHKH